jgi:hypothetical protein
MTVWFEAMQLFYLKTTIRAAKIIKSKEIFHAPVMPIFLLEKNMAVLKIIEVAGILAQG